jgi:hypothetical protein
MAPIQKHISTMKKTRGIITLLAIAMFVSCDSMSYTESISPIGDTELPSTAKVGETITFTIYHTVFNGCGTFSRHKTNIEGKTVTVVFYGKYPKTGMCTDDIPTIETKYSFRAKEKGEYLFRFYRGNYEEEEYLLQTLKVE